MENYFNLTNRQRENIVDSKTRDDRVTVTLMTGEQVDCVDVQPRVEYKTIQYVYTIKILIKIYAWQKKGLVCLE